MITIDTISKKYGTTEVLNISSLQIPKGQSFGLVGNNGAGKTTLFNILLDLIRPTTGMITSNEIQVNKSESWKTFTGSFIDESFLIGYLTPEEYFDFIGDLRGMKKSDIIDYLTQFDEFFNGEVLGKFSGKIKNGKSYGEWFIYHKNGQLWMKGIKKDGKMDISD